MEICKHCGNIITFEEINGGLFCPICGWEKKASEKLKRNEQYGKIINTKPNRKLVIIIGIILLVLAIIGFGNPIAFLLDLWAGIGLLRFKKIALTRAKTIQIIQLIIGGISLIVLIFFSIGYPLFWGWLFYFLIIVTFVFANIPSQKKL